MENGFTSDILNAFLNKGFELTKDDFELYLVGESTLLKREQNLFIWWANLGLSQLSQMAFDILLIPAISAETERVFSGTKLTISPNRNRLGEDIIKATECLNRWYKVGI